MNRTQSTRRGAFTLMELLMVIGIIALLLGILFPVVGKLRKSAYAASTAQSISALQAAIQQYWSTFNAYPGPTGAGGFGAPFTTVTPPLDNISTSEELVLALQGGIKVDFATATVSFVATDVSRGTVSLNPRNPKRYQAFGGAPYEDFNTNTIPEFRDAYPEPAPIHYIRALTQGAATYGGLATLTNAKYPNNGLEFPTPDFADVGAYLRDPSGPTTPPYALRNKDTYILVAAGPDRKFGTKDDITNFGTPGE